MKIFKYKIDREIKMPKGSVIVKVGLQAKVAHIWALVDPDDEMVTRRIWVAMTGSEAPKMPYIGTILHSDSYVEHYFDGGEV